MHRNSAAWCHLTRQVLKELIPRFKGDAAESTSAGHATPRHTRSLRHHGLVRDCVRSTRRLASGKARRAALLVRSPPPRSPAVRFRLLRWAQQPLERLIIREDRVDETARVRRRLAHLLGGDGRKRRV